MSASPQNVFGPRLPHQMDNVRQQIEKGLYTLNRVAKFTDAIGGSAKKFGKDIKETSVHEIKKRSAIEDDGITDLVQVFAACQTVFGEIADASLGFSSNVDGTVVKPANSFLSSAEKTRKALFKKADKLESQTQKLRASVEKDQGKALSEWASLQKTRQDSMKAADKKSDPKGLKAYEKAVKAHAKQRDKTSKAFAKVEKGMVGWNSEKKSLERKEMISLLGEFEALEVERINSMQTALKIFAQQLRELINPLDVLCKQLEDASTQFDGSKALHTYVNNIEASNGKLQKFVPFPLGLPTSSHIVGSEEEKLKWLLLENTADAVNKYEAEIAPVTSDAEGEDEQKQVDFDSEESDDEAPPAPSFQLAAPTLPDSPASSRPPTPPTEAQPIPPPEEEEVHLPMPPAEEGKEPGGDDTPDEYAVALFDFTSDDKEDLQLQEGDVVCVLAKEGDWWRGCKVVDGEWSVEGAFPSNFVGPYEE